MTEEEYAKAKRDFEADPELAALRKKVEAIAGKQNLSHVVPLLNQEPYRSELAALHAKHNYWAESDSYPDTWHISTVRTLDARLRKFIDAAPRARMFLGLATHSGEQTPVKAHADYIKAAILHAKSVVPTSSALDLDKLFYEVPPEITFDQKAQWCIRIVEMLGRDQPSKGKRLGKKTKRRPFEYAALTGPMKRDNPDLTVEQAAAKIGVAPSTIYRALEKDKTFKLIWERKDYKPSKFEMGYPEGPNDL